MRRTLYLLLGLASLGLGAIGAFLPLLPTVPFILLAAFCFARGSPQLERRLIEHPIFGAHIVAWRQRGAISRKGKRGALVAFGLSALIALALLPFPWELIPLGAALIGGSWIWTRPDA
jgi:hypothetical protein